MKTKIETKRNQRWMSFAKLLPALVLALTTAARAETPPAAIPFSDIGTKATADYQGDALGITATADGARLSCGFQKLEGRATTEGLWIESTEPGAAGKLRLVATILRHEDHSTLNVQLSTRLPATGAVSVTDKLVRFTRPGVTEEYSVSVDGVRQDFVIAAPPAGAGDLRVELALNGAHAEATADGAKLRLEGSGRELAYNRLRVTDATGRELTARLEVLSADRLAVSVADADATYPVRIDPTFSDADWVSLNPGIPGANGNVWAMAVDDSGNVYVSGGFTVIGTVKANGIAKWDGNAWSALGSGMSGGGALAVNGTNLYAAGYFTNAGGVAVNNVAKWDGSTWSTLGSGFDNEVSALAVSGTNLYAGGYFTNAGGVTANRIAKWDGSTWSALGSGMNQYVYALAVSGTNLYVGGGFTNAGGATAKYIAKWDGSTWSALGSGMDGGVNALVVNGSNLYAGGNFTWVGVAAKYIAKWDGNSWSALGLGMNDRVYELAVNGTNLYAAGYFTNAGGVTANYIAKWNGSAWSALGSGMDNAVGALAVNGSNLYAGGSFTWAGVAANHIAKWDGNSWSAMGSGMDDWVNALAVRGPRLYVGGRFNTAGEVMANHVAEWNGSAWSALGSGVNGEVNALAVSGTNLYAGGWFTTAGGLIVSNVAKWDGNNWSALGSGIRGEVYALAVGGTNLYVGGSFLGAVGVSANCIAKWNGNAWSALGSGINGNWVNALTVSGTNLYVGGLFKTAGGVSATNIAKWNGSSWSALGSGMNETINALAVGGNNLYAGGRFTKAGGVAANRIAKWDGSTWSALGSGVSGEVYALAVSGTNLYAGGRFKTAGGMSATNIANWNGSTWSALGLGVDDQVRALAADVAGRLFVGGDFSLAGTTVSPYVVQANLSESITVFEQPESQTVGIGATVEFAVVAAGTHAVEYQWYFDVTNAISGATNAILQLTDVQFSNYGAYTVVVTNAFLSVTSAPAILTVLGEPVIQSAPTDTTVQPGGTVEFSVSAFGTLPLSYQWYFNGTDAISAGTNSVLQLASVQHSDSGLYTVVVTNTYGAVTSPPAILHVLSGTVLSCTEALLREAIASGERVTFACDGTITLASRLVITNDTVFDGSGHQVTISGSNAVRVIHVNTNVSLTLVNLTIANGRSTNGGGIYIAGGTVNLTNCTFLHNVAQGFDGPYSSGGPGSDGDGGAIFNAGVLNASSCNFQQNSAWGGQGGSGRDGYSSSFFAWAGEPGGAGGAAKGGAICNFGVAALERSLFVSNTATGGFGGYGGRGDSGPGIPHGSNGGGGGSGGDGSGAAIFNAGTAGMVNCTVALNEGNGGKGGNGGYGGSQFQGDVGIFFWGGSGGPGGDGAGGIYSTNGHLALTSCTLVLNSSIGGTGGTGGYGGRSGEYSGSTGASGVAEGCIAIHDVYATLVNTLLGANSPVNCSGIVLDAGHNLSSDGSCAFSGPGSMNNTDPGLGPLADNGGPTLTMALLLGSPAIDAGDNAAAPPTDQRGVPRPFGSAADIGAFEFWASPPTSPTLQIGRCEGGGIDMLVCEGPIGQSCRLLTSTDLVNWTAIATNLIITTNGTLLFHESSTCEKQRFYRVTILP